MNKAEIRKLVSKFNQYERELKFDELEDLGYEIIQEMFGKKMYEEISDFAQKKYKDYLYYESFEVAFSLVESGNVKEAKRIYEIMLYDEPNNTSVLNNLANIYYEEGDSKKAYPLIKKASKLAPDSQRFQKNLKNIEYDMKRKEMEDSNFKNSKEDLLKESVWALQKLKEFIKNFKRDAELNDGALAISYKKFERLIGTDSQKADSLREQWLRNHYIIETGGRGDYQQKIYRLNPNLEEYIESILPKTIPINWLKSIEMLNGMRLQELGFYHSSKKISRVKRTYKDILQRDLEEMYLSYIFENNKSIVILAGSIIETIFLYYCEKLAIVNLKYTISGKNKIIDVKKAGIDDFLKHFKEHDLFPTIVTAIGDVSRIYRNMVHPANEIYKSKTPINKSKVEICFNAVREIIEEIL